MLILEYLDDGTLAERVAHGPLPIEAIVRCGGAIAEALGHVHERTILHRDIKPSNIGFSRGAGAKLLDFGLARLLEDSAAPIDLPAMPLDLTVTSGIAARRPTSRPKPSSASPHIPTSISGASRSPCTKPRPAETPSFANPSPPP